MPTASGVPSRRADIQQWIGAARTDKLGLAEALLRRHGPQLLDVRAQSIGNTALHWAAAKNHERMLVWLLDSGADISPRNASGYTPIHVAAANGAAASVAVLLSRGADASQPEEMAATARRRCWRRGQRVRWVGNEVAPRRAHLLYLNTARGLPGRQFQTQACAHGISQLPLNVMLPPLPRSCRHCSSSSSSRGLRSWSGRWSTRQRRRSVGALEPLPVRRLWPPQYWSQGEGGTSDSGRGAGGADDGGGRRPAGQSGRPAERGGAGVRAGDLQPAPGTGGARCTGDVRAVLAPTAVREGVHGRTGRGGARGRGRLADDLCCHHWCLHRAPRWCQNTR
jgi:hypothetical protein